MSLHSEVPEASRILLTTLDNVSVRLMCNPPFLRFIKQSRRSFLTSLLAAIPSSHLVSKILRQRMKSKTVTPFPFLPFLPLDSLPPSTNLLDSQQPKHTWYIVSETKSALTAVSNLPHFGQSIAQHALVDRAPPLSIVAAIAISAVFNTP